MRGFFATVPAGLNPADAAVAIAEAELCDAWNRHIALFDAVENPDTDPVIEAARERLVEAGFRLAQIPVGGVAGLAVKAHHLATDVIDGHTAWSVKLAEHLLMDAASLVAGARQDESPVSKGPRPLAGAGGART